MVLTALFFFMLTLKISVVLEVVGGADGDVVAQLGNQQAKAVKAERNAKPVYKI